MSANVRYKRGHRQHRWGAAIGRNRRLVLATVVAAILVATAAVAITGAFAGEQKLSAGAFHDAMRKIWEDHVTWTGLAIVSLVAGLPDTNATVGRLMQNQADIGNAIRPFYGDAAGDHLTALLKDHIAIAIVSVRIASGI